jgi:hypothetical protein
MAYFNRNFKVINPHTDAVTPEKSCFSQPPIH